MGTALFEGSQTEAARVAADLEHGLLKRIWDEVAPALGLPRLQAGESTEARKPSYTGSNN